MYINSSVGFASDNRARSDHRVGRESGHYGQRLRQHKRLVKLSRRRNCMTRRKKPGNRLQKLWQTGGFCALYKLSDAMDISDMKYFTFDMKPQAADWFEKGRLCLSCRFLTSGRRRI